MTFGKGLKSAEDTVSIHATLAGGDSIALPARRLLRRFYPRHPREWRPINSAASATITSGFYPRHPRGWRRAIRASLSLWKPFLSTPPSRVATVCGLCRTPPQSCFYPRHPRGWRRQHLPAAMGVRYVSIHATLAGGDCRLRLPRRNNSGFYPRHPRGWRRVPETPKAASIFCFYPRHPRGWRLTSLQTPRGSCCFYPRHPRGWRPPEIAAMMVPQCVSIHATLAGGDLMIAAVSTGWTSFLSTPPSRVATAALPAVQAQGSCFYPRHPRGWRRRRPCSAP